MALAQAAVYSEKGSPPKKVQSPFEEVDALISSIYMFMLISYLSLYLLNSYYLYAVAAFTNLVYSLRLVSYNNSKVFLLVVSTSCFATC